MSRLLSRKTLTFRAAFVMFIALALAACSSSEQRAQSYYQNGMKLLAAHDNQKAGIEFRNAVRLKKDFLPAWRGLAQAEEASKHFEGLAPVFRTILDLDPKDDATRIKLARLLLAGGAADQSLKLVNEANDPNNASLHALKAVIFYKLKDHDSAIREAQEALKAEPDSSDALLVLAADRLSNNDPNGALQLLSSNSPAQANDLGIQLFKIKIYTQLKEYPQIEALLKQLTEHYPQEVAFRKQLVNLYMVQHRPQDAENELREIAASDPKNPAFGLDLFRFLYTTKGPAAARDELVTRINAGGDNFPYQLALAGLDYDQGKFEDSFKLLKTLGDSAAPDNAVKAKIVLAELNLRQNNVDAADKIVAAVLANDARNVDALKLRATINLNRGQVDAAISDLREALNGQPRSPDLMLMLATAYERSGAIELADKQYADATKASKFAPAVGLNYVAFLGRHGGIDRADDVLAELANRWPNNVQVLSAFAQAKLRRQDWAGAQQIAEAIKRVGGDTGDAADQILGVALSGEHKYDASISAFQNAVAATPSATQPMVDLVGTLVRAKQSDKALAFLQSMLKENPRNAEAYVLRGGIEASNNTPDLAEKDFKTAIESQPKTDAGYRALAGLYISQKKFDAALDVIRAGLKEQPNSAVLQMIVAGILEQKGNYEAAISEYESLLKQQPGSMIVVNNLASLLVDHRTDKADLDRAQSLVASLRDSKVPQFNDTLGWVYYRQGDFKTAVPLLEVATAGMPNNPLVHYHLGMSYAGLGKFSNASEQLKTALTESPNAELESKIKTGLKDSVTQ